MKSKFSMTIRGCIPYFRPTMMQCVLPGCQPPGQMTAEATSMQSLVTSASPVVVPGSQATYTSVTRRTISPIASGSTKMGTSRRLGSRCDGLRILKTSLRGIARIQRDCAITLTSGCARKMIPVQSTTIPRKNETNIPGLVVLPSVALGGLIPNSLLATPSITRPGDFACPAHPWVLTLHIPKRVSSAIWMLRYYMPSAQILKKNLPALT